MSSRAAPTALILALVSIALPTTARPAAGADAPNIIVFLADDLGWAELGCYGQKWIETPRLDRMAAEGTRFTQFYSGQAVCAPARCVLMTGKHTGHAFVRNNREVKPEGQWPLADEEVTIAELLKPAGYATAAIGKWGLGMVGSTGDPNRQGFDLFYGFNCQRHAHNHYPRYLRRNQETETLEGNDRTLTGAQYSQDLFREEALAFIRANRERPFFLYMPFAIPHLSIQAPESSVAPYRGKIPEADYEHKGYLQHPTPRAGYAAMVTHMDRDIGAILDLVAELGLDEKTAVFFTSDNGPTYDRLGGSDSEFFESAGPLRGFKGSLYEGGIRVPLIARWPGKFRAGRVSEHVAAFWDFLPTLCELASVAAPTGIDGVSFAPELVGSGEQTRHEFLYWEFPAYGGQQAVRLGDWKAVRQNLMRRREGAAPPDTSIQLFDLARDVGETTDVAALHPAVVWRMRQIMREARTPSPDFPFAALDE